ncbi:MAG: maltose ABC transporter permease MalF, partial [Burkholderiales bacterium]|nr:maltose ABC transporter permease MalF [Burkholderiales bacterium]
MTRRLVVGACVLALLWLVFGLYTAGQPLTALGLTALGGTAIFVYGTARSVAWKYLFPGVAAMLVFVAFPLFYTVQIGFTNYASNNLLDFDRAKAYLLDQTVADEDQAWTYEVHRDGAQWRLTLTPPEGSSAPALAT